MTFSIIFLIFWSLKKKERTPIFIVLGFLLNFLPFIFIGRVMFLYHYEAALVFSILGLAFLIGRFFSGKNKLTTIYALLGVSLLLFIFFSPLTYGTQLTRAQLENRMWFSSWR